jgi:hypothetical protein
MDGSRQAGRERLRAGGASSEPGHWIKAAEALLLPMKRSSTNMPCPCILLSSALRLHGGPLLFVTLVELAANECEQSVLSGG